MLMLTMNVEMKGKYYGNTGCGVFKEGMQNWKDFWLKINCSQLKLLNFENWSSASCQKLGIILENKVLSIKNRLNF